MFIGVILNSILFCLIGEFSCCDRLFLMMMLLKGVVMVMCLSLEVVRLSWVCVWLVCVVVRCWLMWLLCVMVLCFLCWVMFSFDF